MTVIYTRLYETEAMASDVVSKVKAIDYAQRGIDVITMPAASAPMEGEAAPTGSVTSEAVASQLNALGLYETAAKKYAQKMAPGNAIVVVRAPFGTGKPVGPTMDTVASIDAGVVSEENFGVNKSAPDNIIRVSGTTAIMRISGANSIIKKRMKPGAKPRKKPKPFLGLKTIIHKKKSARRPSNKPITRFIMPLIASR